MAAQASPSPGHLIYVLQRPAAGHGGGGEKWCSLPHRLQPGGHGDCRGDTAINPDIAMNNHQCAHQRFSASSVLSSMCSGRLSGSSGFISSFPNVKGCGTIVLANYSMKQWSIYMPLCTYHTFTFTHRTAQHTNTITVHRIKGFRLHYGVDSFLDPDEEQRVDLPRNTWPRPAPPRPLLSRAMGRPKTKSILHNRTF